MGWLGGPLRYTAGAGLIIDGKETIVQQSDELRAGGDLKRSWPHGATVAPPPIDRPSWARIVQMGDLFRFRGVAGR